MLRTSMRLWRFGMSAVTALSTIGAYAEGGLFVTGHDPDYHAAQCCNQAGAQHIILKALDYTTDGIANNGNAFGNILLITDRHNPGGDQSDPVIGMNATGLGYDTADDGTAGGAVLDLHTVNFNHYGAIIVASDYGGWLQQPEQDILIARQDEILSYIDNGGAVVAFAESGSRQPGITSGLWGWLPFLTPNVPNNQVESGFTVTPFGQSLGLTDADINDNASHNVFEEPIPSGLHVIDRDASQRIVSLAFYGPVNSIPEPSCWALLSAGVVLIGMHGLQRRAHKT